jgi:hypothetical protein
MLVLCACFMLPADLCANKTCPDEDACRAPGTCDAATGRCSDPVVSPDGIACTTTITNKPGSCQDGSCQAICAAGFGGPSCFSCPLGYFSIGGNLFNPSPDCSRCPSGRTTASTKSTNSSACSLPLCSAGTGGPKCGQCSQGFYSPGGSLTSANPSCIQCPASRTTSAPGATSIGACQINVCSPGRGGASCVTWWAWTANSTIIFIVDYYMLA